VIRIPCSFFSPGSSAEWHIVNQRDLRLFT